MSKNVQLCDIAEVCDATKVDSSTFAGNIKKTNAKKNTR